MKFLVGVSVGFFVPQLVLAAVVSMVSPNSVSQNSPSLTVEVTGSGFARQGKIYFSGLALSSSFVSSTKMKALIPASSLTAAGTFQVYYKRGKTVSNSVALTVNAVTQQPPTPTPSGKNDLWVWNDVVTVSTARAEFFAFARARAVRTIYLESQSLIQYNQSALASFINEAASYNMSVELLFGRSSWALAANHAVPTALAQMAVNFSRNLTGARPVGLHFDVEPYLLAEWDSDQNGTANQYLDLFESLASVTAGSGLKLTADIPFWFDGRFITRDGASRVLSEAIIDIVDRVVLMDYRDTASQIISYASSELNYARLVGKEVGIGVETKCGDLAYITFCEEGAAAMDQVLADVLSVVGSNSAFAGFAIHHYGSYKILRP